MAEQMSNRVSRGRPPLVNPEFIKGLQASRGREEGRLLGSKGVVAPISGLSAFVREQIMIRIKERLKGAGGIDRI